MSDAKARQSADDQTAAPNPAAHADHTLTAADARDAQSDTANQLKLQIALQRENQVFTSVSNVLKAKHDTAKNSIGNIK